MFRKALARLGDAARNSGKSKFSTTRTAIRATAWPTTASQRRLLSVPRRTRPRAPRSELNRGNTIALGDAGGVSLIAVMANLPGRMAAPAGYSSFLRLGRSLCERTEKAPPDEVRERLSGQHFSPGRARLSR